MTLHLTDAQASLLEEAISSYWDEGPMGQGWQSKQLEALATEVRRQIKESRHDS